MAGLLSTPGLVDHTLERWSRLPFKWGQTDCFQSVLTYVEAATGRVLQMRPRYGTARGAYRILNNWGGFEAYCARTMQLLGIDRTEQPQRGDVGLINLPESGLTLCLCLGQFWAARGEREVMIFRADPLAAWKVGGAPCHR